MYALYDNVAGCVDVYFTDDDIISRTPVGWYVNKRLTTMRYNFDVYTDSFNPYYVLLCGHNVVTNTSLFEEGEKDECDKLNKVKHAKAE